MSVWSCSTTRSSTRSRAARRSSSARAPVEVVTRVAVTPALCSALARRHDDDDTHGAHTHGAHTLPPSLHLSVARAGGLRARAFRERRRDAAPHRRHDGLEIRRERCGGAAPRGGVPLRARVRLASGEGGGGDDVMTRAADVRREEGGGRRVNHRVVSSVCRLFLEVGGPIIPTRDLTDQPRRLLRCAFPVARAWVRVERGGWRVKRGGWSVDVVSTSNNDAAASASLLSLLSHTSHLSHLSHLSHFSHFSHLSHLSQVCLKRLVTGGHLGATARRRRAAGGERRRPARPRDRGRSHEMACHTIQYRLAGCIARRSNRRAPCLVEFNVTLVRAGAVAAPSLDGWHAPPVAQPLTSARSPIRDRAGDSFPGYPCAAPSTSHSPTPAAVTHRSGEADSRPSS